jgi:NAD(P)-dependent dehydrogenase (short-subunit alcohol dehydrogenase family)
MSSTSSQRVCLVTGGAGFIGSYLVEHLAARGDRVVVVDDLSTGRRSNLAAVDEARMTFIEETVSEALPGLDPSEFDEIYHLAAAVGVRLVIRQPIGTIETNVLQTSAALEFAAAGSTPILVASTSEVYGKAAQLPFAEDDDVVYGPPTQPRWAYACSKAIDEFLALAYHKERGLPVVVVRFFNIVGPRQVGQYGMVLPRLVAAALAGKPLEASVTCATSWASWRRCWPTPAALAVSTTWAAMSRSRSARLPSSFATRSAAARRSRGFPTSRPSAPASMTFVTASRISPACGASRVSRLAFHWRRPSATWPTS